MGARHYIFLVGLACLFITACCKPEESGGEPSDPFAELTQKNELPFRLPVDSAVANLEQTKGLSFYAKDSMDIVFRSAGISNATMLRTRLWVQILNPDLRVFADTRIDSSYIDTIYVNGSPIQQVHNRDDGKNFFKLDTALLALPFTIDELDTKRPSLFDHTVVTVHVQFSELYDGTNIPYDIERGALKRTNHTYIGFKNIKDGRLFFVELEDRYVLKSIAVRKD